MGRLAGAQHGIEGNWHPLGLPALVGVAGGGEELLGLFGLLPHAEHMASLLVQVVALGEALAGEGGLELIDLLGGGLPVLMDGPGENAGDHRHILGPLHPALQLDALHPHLPQVPQVARQRQILQGQGVGVRLTLPAVLQPTGLGAQAPVARAPPDDGGQETLTGVTHAQGPVGEHLDLNGGVLADVFDLVPGQFPGEHRTGHAQVGHHLDAVQVVDGHLGGGVDQQVGGHLAHHPQHTHVLYQHRIGPQAAGLGGELRRLGQLPVGEQGVQGQIHLGAPHMAIRNRRRKFLPGEILRVAAGIKISVSQIDGVRAVLYSRRHGLHGPGGGEQFQHTIPPGAGGHSAPRFLTSCFAA